MTRATRFLVVFQVAALWVAVFSPSRVPACIVTDIVVWNPFWDCGVETGPRFHRQRDWRIHYYSVYVLPENQDWVLSVQVGVAGLDGINDKAVYYWIPTGGESSVRFDYDGTLYDWHDNEMANVTKWINPCGGWIEGPWTMRFNAFDYLPEKW